MYLIAIDPERRDPLGDLSRLDRRELRDGRQTSVLGQGHGDVVQSVRKAPYRVLRDPTTPTEANSKTKQALRQEYGTFPGQVIIMSFHSREVFSHALPFHSRASLFFQRQHASTPHIFYTASRNREGAVHQQNLSCNPHRIDTRTVLYIARLGYVRKASIKIDTHVVGPGGHGKLPPKPYTRTTTLFFSFCFARFLHETVSPWSLGFIKLSALA